MVLLASGLSWAADMNPNGYFDDVEYEHDFSQDVEGSGYVCVYQNINTNNLSLKNIMHGSGTVDSATLIDSWQASTRPAYYYTTRYGEVRYSNDDSNISLTEQNEMTYAPSSFVYGTGYYEANPVDYNSKLKEKTSAKNYQAATSMHHQIEYAAAFNKDLGVNLECTGATTDADGVGLTHMWLEESVVDGNVHVGELLTDSDHSWKKPLIEIDENYVGSFTINKDMKINVPKGKLMPSSDWLDCCFGGFADINTRDHYWGESGIFDCTCRADSITSFDPTWNGTEAQFPRNYTTNPA
jgi:hypothetical protein